MTLCLQSVIRSRLAGRIKNTATSRVMWGKIACPFTRTDEKASRERAKLTVVEVHRGVDNISYIS